VSNVGKLYKELQDIIEWFESAEDVDVDESLKKYEKADKIAKELKKQISTLENKITKAKDFSAE